MAGLCYRENLPAALPEAGTLYLALPFDRTTGVLRTFLRRIGLPFSEPYTCILAISVAGDSLDRFSIELENWLSRPEIQATKALLLPRGVVPALPQLFQMQSLGALVARVRSKWLVDMLQEGRLISYFQPIVSADGSPSVYAYEALLRGTDRNGRLVYPDVMFAAASSADLLYNLDNAARLLHIQTASQHCLKPRIFLNINPLAIYEPESTLSSTIHAVKAAGLAPGQVVFEFVEGWQADDVEHLLSILNFYHRLGFQVALDDLEVSYHSIELLTRLRPDFVKLSMDLIHRVDLDPAKADVANRLLELARRLHIKTIAEGIETHGECEWARTHGADFMQGYFFARPASPPPSIRRQVH
jgi:EAL domain-containing protein (putative c-di-GMP-specific phosphodiesterase class I)